MMNSSARRRILYLIGQLVIGGAERQLTYLAENIDRDIYEPVVCSLSRASPLADELRSHGLDVIILPKKMSPDLTRLWRVLDVARRYQPDLIHSYMFVANTWARMAGRILHIPVVVSERSSEDKKNRQMVFVDRLLASWTTFLVANSMSGAKAAIRRREITPKKVVVIPNGVDLPHFSDDNSRIQVRKEFGFSDRQPVIGMVSRLDYPKDYETFFRAAEKLQGEFPDLRVLCVGDGPRRSQLEEWVAEKGLGDTVIFTGMRSDVHRLLYGMDVFVFSTRYEGLPNAVLEAMAASRPVVATNVGGVPEVVKEGGTGLLVPPGNAPKMADAIASLLRDPDKAIAMGKCGRMLVENHFTLDGMVKNTEKLYEQILAEKRCNDR